jgi:dihydroorotase
MSTIVIRGGRIVDPANQRNEKGDVWIVEGRLAAFPPPHGLADVSLDASGMIVCPGLIDPRVSLREPGFEEDETIETGTAAALAGGFTTIGAMPDTAPVVETRAAAEFVSRQAERAGNCRVVPLGAVTKEHAGQELAEMAQLVDGGATAFTDGKRPIANSEVMRRALQYAGMLGRTVLHHPHVPELVTGAIMHEGFYSMKLGLRGMPTAAEEIMVRRDIALAEYTGSRMHLMGISSRNSVDEVRQAQQRGVRVTADVTPHHLVLTDASLESYDSHFKVDPPLRPREHIDALIDGLQDGTIDVISADHEPWAAEEKSRELDVAPFGIAGLETLLPVCIQTLIEPGHLTWPQLISKLTVGPARLLGLKAGTLAPGAPADVTVIDPAVSWTIDAAAFRSKSRNTPFDGWDVHGRAVYTIVGGEIRYRAAQASRRA